MSGPSRTRALVLGGGGAVGWAWEVGLMAGFADRGLDLRIADLIIGTSAGAIVGARLALDLGFEPPSLTLKSAAGLAASAQPDAATDLAATMARAGQSAEPDLLARARIGRTALEANAISEAASLARPVFAPFLGRPWPAQLCVVTVGAQSGHRRVWDATSGAPLDRAAAASSAVPGVWPPVTIGDERYMDGGVWSMLNADLAVGFSRVVVVSCFPLAAGEAGSGLAAATAAVSRGELDGLRASGGALAVVEPRPDVLALSGHGRAMMDVGLMPEAYRLGRAHALAEAEPVRRFWSAGSLP